MKSSIFTKSSQTWAPACRKLPADPPDQLRYVQSSAAGLPTRGKPWQRPGPTLARPPPPPAVCRDPNRSRTHQPAHKRRSYKLPLKDPPAVRQHRSSTFRRNAPLASAYFFETQTICLQRLLQAHAFGLHFPSSALAGVGLRTHPGRVSHGTPVDSRTCTTAAQQL